MRLAITKLTTLSLMLFFNTSFVYAATEKSIWEVKTPETTKTLRPLPKKNQGDKNFRPIEVYIGSARIDKGYANSQKITNSGDFYGLEFGYQAKDDIILNLGLATYVFGFTEGTPEENQFKEAFGAHYRASIYLEAGNDGPDNHALH